MKALVWVAFVVILVGVVFYGYAKAVLLTVLVGGGLFFGSSIAWGVAEAMAKRMAALRAAPLPDPNTMKDADKRARMQARALRDIDVVAVPASDAELAECADWPDWADEPAARGERMA